MMETVLRRLRLKRGESQESDARKRLQKELFEFSACSEHGFPQKPSALAYDPMLSLLAVGTENGDVRIYGKPGVYFSGKHENCLSVVKMQFLPDQGRLVTFCTDNSLHLWEINVKPTGATVLEEVKSSAMENSKLKMVTSHFLMADSSQLLLGTDGGSIHFLDTEPFTLTDKVIFQDLILQNAADDLKANPGAVEAVLQHPSAADKILIGYNRGLIVLWDMTENRAEYTYTTSEAIEALAFNDDGSEFICAQADGSYVVWTTNRSQQPKENPYTPYGPFPCKAITSVSWKSAKDGTAWMVFHGGMPRANFSDRHTVSVVHGSSHVTFDFSSRVIDFILLCQPTGNVGEPQCVIVMTEIELVAIDLTTDGWPLYRVPYLLGVSASSPVTCVQHVAGVSDAVWNNLVTAGNAEVDRWSTKDWPITGGELTEKTSSAGHNILLTGHADGKVCFWDMNLSAATSLLYCLNTASIFVTDAEQQESSSAPADEDWPPFRKVGSSCSSDEEKRFAVQKLAFCPSSGKLLVGGAGGHVTLFTFESESGERHVETTTMDFTACQEGFVWNGPEALSVKSDVNWSSASYQPLCVAVAYPPAACTALSVSHSQLVAMSTSYGFGVLDLVRSKMVYATSVSVPSGVKISRSRSFQRVKESFQQLRRHKSESDHKLSQKSEQKEAETKPETTEKPEEKSEEKQEGTPEVVVETAEKVEKLTIEETKTTETEVTAEKTESKTTRTEVTTEKTESKQVEKIETKEVITTESTEQTVQDTKAEDVKDSKDEPEIIAVEEAPKPEDTTDGAKSAEVHEGEAVTATQSKTSKPTREQQTVMTNIESLYFADTYLFQGQPKHLSLWVGTRSGHVFIYQLTVPDGEKRREEDVTCFLAKEIRLKHGAPVVATFIVDRNLYPLSETAPIKGGSDAESPAATGAHRLIVCSQQQIKIFSLPNFKPHHKYKLPTRDQDARFVAAEFATFLSKSDESYSESDLVCMTNHGKLCVFSLPHLRRQLCTDTVISPDIASGPHTLSLAGGIYCASASELAEFTVSARQAAAGCCVPLKEGMRPAPVVAEETEVAEVGKDEKEAEKSEEPAAAGKVEVSEQLVSPADEKVAGVNDSVASGNDSVMASGDVTMDSIKEHAKEAASPDSAVVSSHKVVQTTVHTVKTVGGSVSESKTTTVEELKTVEGIITSCMETTSSTTSAPAEKIEGN